MKHPAIAQAQQPLGMQYPAAWWPGGGPPPPVLRGKPLRGGAKGTEHAGSIEARTISADPTKRKIRTWQEPGASGDVYLAWWSVCAAEVDKGICPPAQAHGRPQQAPHRYDYPPDIKH
ncbi:unnamed protein product [Laminaria digitata]